MSLTQCFVDESVYDDLGIVITAFIFTAEEFDAQVTSVLSSSGIDTPREEFKSSARMDADPRMRVARESLLRLARSASRIGIFVGPFSRSRLGRQVLQAAQSVVLRNAHAIDRATLSIYFDQEIFPSDEEAERLHGLFEHLKPSRIFGTEDSKLRVGIQVADCVAHSFGQIVKAAIKGRDKAVDVSGPDSGYAAGTEAPLGWVLLMSLRHALLTRPIVYRGEAYPPECDPVVVDPIHDDPVDFGQHPVLLGWGVQVAPEANESLRQAVEGVLGRVWLGCTH
jgi:hypothetical protein